MLKSGDLAPDFDALTSTGARFKLSEQSGRLCTVVYFFPKAFTPGCELETKRFRDNYPELALSGAALVGVSTDDHDTQCLFAKEMRAPFPIIADEGKTISRAYGVLWPILERPMRVTFVVDARRRIEAVLHHEIDIGRHRDEVLRLVDAMKRQRSSSADRRVDVESTIVAPKTHIVTKGAEPFEVIREAGSGGMGTVYLARDRESDRIVAVKVLAKEADPARFEREIELLSRLVHPNVVRYVRHGVADDGRTFLAMEWLDGESLATKLLRGPLGIRESVRVAREIAAGLAAAHEAGVVHRDIKPNNVLVLAGGAVKIVDFGVARAEDVASSLTRTGEVVGTPAYMAPEQSRSGRVDARTDLFALGCLLFRCIAGRRPFDGSDVMELLHNVMMREAPPLVAASERVPDELAALYRELVAKDMDARPQSAGDVRDRLDALFRRL